MREAVDRAEERAKEGAVERADDSILETKILFERREAVERAEESRGAEERAENSILETKFHFQMPSTGASCKRNSVSKRIEAVERAAERAEEPEQKTASWKRNSVSRCPP